MWLGQYMREVQFSSGLGVSFRWNRLEIEVTFLRKYKARVAGTVHAGGSVQCRPRGELPLESASDRGNLSEEVQRTCGWDSICGRFSSVQASGCASVGIGFRSR